jgi:hypothetical protein
MADKERTRKCWSPVASILCLSFVAAGCGPGFKVVPVTGKITVDGKPLSEADVTVLFRPNASKGNSIKLEFSGMADENGDYTLCYGDGIPGASPGWYKVAVVATEQQESRGPPKNRPKRRLPGPGAGFKKSLIDNKYNVADNSGIEIEVVENPGPGAYDFNLIGAAKK